ncbi:hypothetical protein BDV36DRAFT_298257 [Aspergillus pseudocaelatus]|uniref:Uncharacterized protein n=1 Tax=Aspergillus pseudocaelatus TaxID=1825620 RepID=A0ABQ6WDU5_9EURO|nr:hypothetical protein BDV36DRAFT_298257 [Aspergillus pseudocaelatus]
MQFNKSLLAAAALSLFTSGVFGKTIMVSYGSPQPTDNFRQDIELDQLVALDHPYALFLSSHNRSYL